MIALLMELYSHQTGATRGSPTFLINRGVRQGDVISSILFNAVLEFAFQKWKARLRDHGWRLDNTPRERLTNTRYADDMMLFAKSFAELEEMLSLLKEELERIGLEMHESKTKVMTSFNENELDFVDIDGLMLEILPYEKAHKYLGRMISCSTSRATDEISNRIKVAWGCFHKHRKWLVNKHVPVQLRLRLFDSVVTPAALFSLASLPLSSSLISQLGVAQRKMLRSIVGWVRLPSDDWATTMRRMRSRLDNASRLHFVSPWEFSLKRSQWKYAQHLANFGSDSWQRLVIQWEPAFVLDMSLEFAPHRGRGRPRTRWYDDLTKFAEQTWNSSDWLHH